MTYNVFSGTLNPTQSTMQLHYIYNNWQRRLAIRTYGYAGGEQCYCLQYSWRMYCISEVWCMLSSTSFSVVLLTSTGFDWKCWKYGDPEFWEILVSFWAKVPYFCGNPYSFLIYNSCRLRVQQLDHISAFVTLCSLMFQGLRCHLASEVLFEGHHYFRILSWWALPSVTWMFLAVFMGGKNGCRTYTFEEPVPKYN